jgi:hypothetical protein
MAREASQITVRGVSPELASRLKKLASARGESVNSTVLRVLEHAAGIDERGERLRRYATWSDDDLEEFEQALRAQRTIDAELWK